MEYQPRYFAYFFIIILITALGYSMYTTFQENNGWRGDWVCSKETALTKQDMIDGWKCILEECRTVETKYNARVQECICSDNGKTIRKICTEELSHRTYFKGGFDRGNEGWQETFNMLNALNVTINY